MQQAWIGCDAAHVGLCNTDMPPPKSAGGKPFGILFRSIGGERSTRGLLI